VAGLIALVTAAIGILCWVPPVSRDALTHHLAVPKLWILNHGMVELPHLPFSYYPMNLDLLYMVPLLFHNDILPKYIHFLFGLLTAFLIFRYLRPRLNATYALTGSLFFLSTPIIIKLCITAYVDLGLIFFTFAAILYFFKWMVDTFRMKHLILSGIMCGLAMGTKYQGLIVLLLLTLSTPMVFIRSVAAKGKNQFRALIFSAIFLFSALLVFSPWMIRNAVWTGNPIHPLFKSRFSETPPSRPDPSAQQDRIDPDRNAAPPTQKAWGHFNVRRHIYQESGWETLTTPIRIFFQGRDDQPKYFDGKLNPFLLFLSLLAFIRLHRDAAHIKKEKIFLATFSFLYLMIVYLQADMRIRYIAPILPPLAILAMFGLYNLKNMLVSARKVVYGRRLLSLAAPLVVAIMFCLNGAYLMRQFSVVDPFSYIMGHQDRNDYITRYRPEFGVIRYANLHLSQDSRILAVFLGRRGYYSDREMIFDFSFMEKSVKVPDEPGRLYREFTHRGITHLLFRYDLFNHWVNSGVFNDTERGSIKRFLSTHTQLVYTELGHGLYRLIETQDRQP